MDTKIFMDTKVFMSAKDRELENRARKIAQYLVLLMLAVLTASVA